MGSGDCSGIGPGPAGGDGARHLDHHSSAFAEQHLEWLREARARCPVLRSACHGGFSLLVRHADVRAALLDSRALSSERFPLADGRLGGGVAIPPNAVRVGIIEMEGERASALRALLKPWFAPAAVAAARERIAEIARWLIDRVIARGSIDAVEDLARPMPSLLILDILGLPLDCWDRYGRVLHAAVAKAAGSAAGLRWLAADLDRRIAGGDFDPDGLLAALVAAGHRGALPDPALVAELALMLLFGGTDTTIAAIGHMLRHLSEFPGLKVGLVADRQRLSRTVEELLRLHSPATAVARTVIAPITIAGQPFVPGDRLLLALGSANRDEAAFADGERFRLDRPGRPHLAFGCGTHACLGQHLARAELGILLGEVLRRMPDFTIDRDGTQRDPRIPLVNGHRRMPMRFTPAAPDTAPTAWPRLTARRLQPV